MLYERVYWRYYCIPVLQWTSKHNVLLIYTFKKDDRILCTKLIRYRLMQEPYVENCGNIEVKINLAPNFPTVSAPKYLHSIRFLLQQSSGRWDDFGISNVAFFSFTATDSYSEESKKMMHINSVGDLTDHFSGTPRMCQSRRRSGGVALPCGDN